MKISVLCLVLFLGYINTERILGVFPFSAKSHFFTFEPLLLELAKRGHELTVISCFPRKPPVEHYTDINITGSTEEEMKLTISMLMNFDLNLMTVMSEISQISYRFEDIYRDERVENLLNSTVKFDLIISELFLSDMFVGLAHRFQAPLVMLSSSEVVPWGTDRFALQDNPSYILNFFTKHVSNPMNLYDRAMNTLEVLFAKFIYEYSILTNDERVSKKYLGKEIPHVKELIKRTSIVLVNSHFSVNGARALPPQVIEIGGIHIKPSKLLPQDIEKFINESEHGVVYFSLGSVTNASTMSAETRKAFCDVFSKLPQRVLWKWEVDEMPEKPPNVKTVKWMPQRDVLAHPNIRLFITHGGLLGTMEGVYSGVPMIGIPLFGDQTHNIANLENLGYAIRLEMSNITRDSVSWAVNSVLNDPKYRNTALRLSQIFRDRPATALDTAVYWTEYVMKHNGAHHLRTAAVGMPWYQYFLIDVIIFILLAITFIVFVFIYTVKIVLRKICNKRKVKLH